MMTLPVADRTLVMGVLNLTPDSFSDGGEYLDLDRAVEHGLQMVSEGADLIDIGGESTRPGAQRVDAAEEQRRVVPVIEALVAAGITVSVDTMRASTAAQALAAGATIVNDVSGGLADSEMIPLIAGAGCGYIAMHWRGHSDQMQAAAQYTDVVDEVCAELQERIDVLAAAGITELAIDPGLGFAKEPEHNWALLRSLDRLQGLGYPLLIGASRKRFLGRLLAEAGEDREVHDREAATIAISALAAHAGAWAIRVHQVKANADAVRVAAAMRNP